ncbi:protein KIAA0100-like isoform X2 [Stegodyphus dumicola]|uniref:protein KIAA0100-like isoform X2 n=1 Tax=Stegodyphus dumicola TaxID=202533 RepID=UPI0015A75CA8|nr:protein KIAA0100-like isoform X2 [Stegodyphus dumicola]
MDRKAFSDCISIKLLSWFLYRKYGMKLKVGGYGFLGFRDIHLQLRNGLKLEIEYVGLNSYLFSSNLKNFFVICINDIRLQGDTDWIKSYTPSTKKQSERKIFLTAFPSCTFLLKFVSLYILNASVMQLGKSDEEFLLHFSFQEFNLYCCCVQSSFQINMAVSSFSVKVFKHLPHDQEQYHSSEACICHFSSNLFLIIQANSSKVIPFQSVCAKVGEPELMLYEGFSLLKFKNYATNNLQTQKQQSDEETKVCDEGSVSSNDLKRKFRNVPQISDVSVDLFSVKVMMEGGHRTFTFGIKLIALHLEVGDFLEDAKLPNIVSQLEVKEVSAASDHIQIGHLLKLALEINVIDKLVDAKFSLSLLHILYQKEILQYFLSTMMVSNQNMQFKSEPNFKRKVTVKELLYGYKIKTTADVEDVCISFKIPDCETFSFGLMNGQSSLEHYIFNRHESNTSQNLSLNGGSSLEFLLETLYFKLGDTKFADFGMLKRYHFYNIPISIGVLLLKARSSQTDQCCDCMFDGCQLQWSPSFSHLVMYLLKFVKNSFSSDISAHKLQNSSFVNKNKKSVGKSLSVDLSFTGLNLFAFNECRNGIVIRADTLNLNSSTEKLKMAIQGFKLGMLNSVIQVYQCVKASEIKNYETFVMDSSILYIKKDKSFTVRLSEIVYLLWNSTLHMTVFTIFQECLTFKSNVQNFCNNIKSAAIQDQVDEDTSSYKTGTDSKKTISWTFSLQARGNISIGAILSKMHKTSLVGTDFCLSFNHHLITSNSKCITWVFDDHDIFIYENAAVSLMPGTEQQQLCRQGFDALELSNNRILSFHFDSVKFIFPYKYNFAEAFSEEYVNVIKWLKILHKKKKTPFTLESKLPPDLQIICKVWTIELEDDPFEVKLRDNFELLEDEYHESLKRKRMLDEKIENFRRTNLLLPSEKINLLYSKLAKKNAEIYIQRSQQLYLKNSMRTSLCTWRLDDIEFIAIADTSYHGTERVIRCMKLLDAESPYPEEGIEFTTLWARKIRCTAKSWTWQMRDFPQMPLQIRELNIWGFLIGAEEEASHRARRTSKLEIDDPWSTVDIERSMQPLKFYHDLTFDMEEMSMAYGPSWEPVVSQISLAVEFVSRPSLDPSPALPWWDKMRLLYHGRLTILAQHLILYMRASLDPYNTTEHMEISWSDVFIEWTTGKVLTKGNLDMYVHTASKYDDIRVLRIPHLKLSINFDWLCLGNPYDHHNVTPCAPDKVPEYSINQEHDSYRAFRSQNLNISYSYETKHMHADQEDIPTMLLYSSTLKWIENLKMILSGVTRLTRRGVLFSNTKPRKPQLSRHYHRLCVSLNLHKFKIIYWMSFAKQRGLELIGGHLFLSSEHTQTLVPVADGLKHRPRANWNIGYLNSELTDSEIWLYNCMDEENENATKSFHAPVERSYFLSVNRVSYGREEIVKDVISEEDQADTPTHRLVVHGLKGAWTRHNRLVIFSLFDSYQKTVILKKNLSTDALRCFKVESQNTPQRSRAQTSMSQNSSVGPSPISSLQSSHVASMLQKLVAESEANPTVFIEEIEGTTREQQLHGVAACQTNDVLQKKWLIELVNSQVMLKGCETSGYVIVSAAKARILQKLHIPVWKDRSLVSKTTWVGSFECMQYYATVDAGSPSPSVDDVMWLSVDNIEEKESMVISDLPDLVGSGHSAGGVVSSTVGATSDPQSAPTQLQRIVSRCGCQFFYAGYGENINPSGLEEVPPLPEDNDLWEKEVAVDSFTLTHHDLDICTNSLQYAMILDVVNNLLLYVEPRKKEATDKLQYMRFQLQLLKIEDQRGPILQLQENIRSLVSNLRRLEKEAYAIHKLLLESSDREDLLEELHVLDHKIYEHKEQLNSMNEELTMMISCFKETQIIASRSRQRASSQEKVVSTSRRSEVCFKHAQWRLTDADGQLGISDLILSNFLYSKVAKTDDSVEHLLEIGYIKMRNLLPNQAYKIVLQPTDVQTKIPLDRQCLLRIYCRERAPVGGISIKEHLEVNVVPITIGLTEAFYKAMLKFFFPGRDTEKADDHSDDEEPATSKKTFKQKRSATFYGERDDIEKMKERADKNHTFFSIKIPEVPIRVSYKGRKEKNIEDVHDLSLVLSTLEYHNKTWTWLDLLMALKNDAKRILLSQAIKQKLLKSRNIPEKDNQPQEDEIASILLGTHSVGSDRTLKKGFLSRMKKDHH